METEQKSRRSFANRLRRLLHDKDVTQAELARRSDISEPTISRYCHGGSSVSMHNVRKIANALGCDISELVD